MAVGPERIEVLPRAEVIAFLERLGHDPNKVASIHVTPHAVDVVYTHPIVDSKES